MFRVYFGPHTVDSNKLEHGPGTICAGFPSSQRFGVGGRSDFNFLAPTQLILATAGDVQTSLRAVCGIILIGHACALVQSLGLWVSLF